MGRYAIQVLSLGLAIVDTAAWAQTQPPPATGDQLLSNGYLGDQNFRLSGSQDASPEAPFPERAAAAIMHKDYGRALAILRPHRLTDPLVYHYLAGLAHEGRADYPAARKEFAEALKKRKNFTAAQVALGMVEAEHGDKASAISILRELIARQETCAGACADSAQLLNGVLHIQAALKARSG